MALPYRFNTHAILKTTSISKTKQKGIKQNKEKKNDKEREPARRVILCCLDTCIHINTYITSRINK